MKPAIDYASLSTKSSALPISEFEFEREQERGRWLRRRFLWYCAVSVIFIIVSVTPGLMFGEFWTESSIASVLFYLFHMCGSLILLSAAFIWTYKAKPRYSAILRVAMLTYLIGGVWGIFAGRLIMSSSTLSLSGSNVESQISSRISKDIGKPANAELNELKVEINSATGIQSKSVSESTSEIHSNVLPAENESSRILLPASVIDAQTGFREGLIDGLLDASKPSTQPISSPTTRQSIIQAVAGNVQPISFSVIWSPVIFSLLISHLIICIFLPWTFRESVRPAIMLGSITVGLIACEAVIRQFSGFWILLPLGLMLLSIMSFVPGSALCWWRYSSFNKHFKRTFESKQYQQLTQEISGARNIHDAALPKPRLTGPLQFNYAYEPMRLLGGDLLYIHEPRERLDTMDVIVFDVTGHGIAAALTVNRLLGELDRTFGENDTAGPDVVLANLDRYIALTMAKHQIFVTAIAMRIDTAAGRLTYANAGHPHALYLPANGEPISLSPTAMILGAADPGDFTAEPIEIPFAPGDKLVCYTDGASEAFNTHTDAMLEREGVEELIRQNNAKVPAGDLPYNLLQAVTAFRQSPPTDDTLFVVVFRPE